MARDYSSEYQARVEAAQERGYDSLYEQTQARAHAREELGDGAGRDAIWEYADFTHNFGEGDYDRDTLRDIYDEFYPDGDDDGFYEWLADLYSED